jgi:predicted DNA-binding transcriptional regulator AlpA
MDPKFLSVVIEAAADPERREAILTAARVGHRARMGTVEDAASILGTCRRTVERYAREGAFPRVHLSARMVRYDLNAVEAFARSGRG